MTAEASAPPEGARVQILVPVYNEGENAVTLHEELSRTGADVDAITFVYDFDEDTTLPYIAKLRESDPRVSALKNDFGRGVVNALRKGFSAAEDGPVIVVMGDNSDKLDLIPEIVAAWKSGAKVVSPSRYMKGGRQVGGGFVKAGLSRLAGKSLALFGFPTCDPTNNFKMYDGAWLRQQEVESVGGFEVALELSYKAWRQGHRIVEVPTVWTDRTEGESKFKLFAWLPHYLRWYFRAMGCLMFRRPRPAKA